MKTAEGDTRRRRIVIAVAGIALVLVAAVIGLSLGNAATPKENDSSLTTEEAIAEARKSALAEVEQKTNEQGLKDGRKSGARQGARAGRRAGESDGGVAVQQQATEAAEAAAASAQSELSAIAAPPPPP